MDSHKKARKDTKRVLRKRVDSSEIGEEKLCVLCVKNSVFSVVKTIFQTAENTENERRAHRELNLHFSLFNYCQRIIFCVSLCLFAAIGFSSVTNAQEFSRGQIIPKVACKSDAQQTYALYLPSTYSNEKRFPVIYAFDPVARGVLPVERFKEAAEKFGYIVVGSHNSRNGLGGKDLIPIINTLINDTLERFSIDSHRAYFTGFSGGARVASGFALGCKGCAAGVILCGAGFPPEVVPTKDLPFPVYGTVGDEDFNFPEMKILDEALNKLNLPHRIVTFEGAHDWASSEYCVKALEWLEIQAMRAGSRTKDEKFLESVWKREFEKGSDAESKNKLYDAYVSYLSLAQDFKDLRDVSEVEKKVSLLRENKAVRQALKDERDEISKQNTLTNKLISQGVKAMSAESFERSAMIQDLRNMAADVRKTAQSNEDTSERRVARRSLRQAFAYYYETAIHNFLQQKKNDQAIFYMEIVTELQPKNAFAFVELARVYALSKQKKQAIQTLQKAVEKGFNDLKTLEENKDFDILRGESDWQKLIANLREKSSSKQN